ncbi:MFS transporter [Streptomyces graminifolii]|uniref:MFS transporter n=1 Tax=Streptomyces graminifolii TaxID=1266771 RepID=UPI004058AB01
MAKQIAMDAARARAGRPVQQATVFLVALCLRPAITAVGPLLTMIGASQHLSEGVLGVLAALPLMAFAVISPLVHRMSGPLGAERSILLALLLLAMGCVMRSYLSAPGLWVGTFVVGAAIAAGNVLVPVIVKRDYTHNVSRATGVYSACITLAAAIASAVVVPLSDVVDWRFALAIWAVLAVVVAAAWLPRARVRPALSGKRLPPRISPQPSVWRQPTGWSVTAFFGLQSTAFYVLVTWLPTIETSTGIAARDAGVHLFVFQAAGMVGGLAVPILMRHTTDQTTGAVTASLPMVAALLGLLFAPGLVLLWAVVAGLGQGAALVVALSLISLRGRSPQETTQLSGMAQSVGYLFAAAGPVAAGNLAEWTGGWDGALTMLAVLATLQVGAALAAGRDHRAPLAS